MHTTHKEGGICKKSNLCMLVKILKIMDDPLDDFAKFLHFIHIKTAISVNLK